MPLREPVSPLVLLQAAPAPTGNRNARRTTGRKEDRRDKPVGNSVPSLPTSKRYLSRKQRSEEHTSELQSRQYLVCRLLLEKKQPHIDEVDVHPVDRRHELRQRVELRLPAAPVLVGRPVVRECLHLRELHALLAVGHQFPGG